jgi:rare lipoprotein A
LPSYFQYTVKKGDTLWGLAVKRFHVNLEDIIRDNNIEDPNKIYPGQKLIIRRPALPQLQEVTASWYGEDYHGRPMANGEPYDMYAATIAHKHIPLGTRVELENPATGERVRAIVTDRGPFVAGRDVDLSYGLARRLSLVEKGIGRLLMKIV